MANCKIESLEIPTATDNCTSILTVTNDITFPITENTLVTWSYEDESGNIETQTQNVIINQANILLTALLTDEISNNSGEIDLTIAGDGTEPFTFSWSNGESTEDITGLMEGDYTVTVTDNDGCVTDSTFNIDSQVGIEDKEDLKVSVYPNPANDNIIINSDQLGAVVGIYGIDGKLVMSEFTLLSNQTVLSLNDLNTGVYFVKITSNKFKKTVRLIVK